MSDQITRICKKCNVEKPLRSFPRRYRRGKDGEIIRSDMDRNWQCHRCGHQCTIRVWMTRCIRNLRGRHSRYHRGLKFRKAEHVAEFDIDTDYAMEIYEKQAGLCAMSGMRMTHESLNLRSVSIDRIDNARGHIKGNIQLVCVWVNMARGRYSVEEFAKILDEFRQVVRQS